MPRTFPVILSQKLLIGQNNNAICRRLPDTTPLSGSVSSFDTETGGGNSFERKPIIMSFAFFSSRMHREILNALVMGMCIVPIILGNPFFQTVARGDPVSSRIQDRLCAVARPQYTAKTTNIICANSGANTVICAGTIRVYNETRSCGGKPAPGYICMPVELQGDFVEYPGTEARTTEKSTAEIALCLGWSMSAGSCIISLMALIGGIVITPMAAGVAVFTTYIGALNAGNTVVRCGPVLYNVWCNSGCCFLNCLPGRFGTPQGVRPSC